jgi:NADPH:quinone reductase
MTTVKAIRVNAAGAPDTLRYEDVALAPPGRGEAQIRHHAIGVNYIDVYRRSGLYPAPLPFIPGHEGAGEVIAVGEGVEDLKKGDRVAYLDAGLGGYAAARNIAAAALVRLPKFLSYEQGAAMMLKGLTAEYLLRRTFKVKKGHRVLVQAGAGGVGQLLCQWASARGAKVIATVGSAEKAEIARKAGADHTILYRDEDFVAKVREFTKGKLCHVVYDGVGRATFPASLDCLKPFGLFVSFGSASGPIAAFDMGLLAQKGSLYATRPSLFTHIADVKTYRAMTEEVIDALKRDDIAFDAITARPLAQAEQVHADLEARKTTGSIVLTP